MNRIPFVLLAVVISASIQVPSVSAEEEPGFESIFDGKSLDGWDGNPSFWKVKDGKIVDNWVMVDFPGVMQQLAVDPFGGHGWENRDPQP